MNFWPLWETRGVVVSQNTFYQNISLLRKSLLKAGLISGYHYHRQTKRL
jgi:DNA-binding winged helix-turn-helix (wHTH) protein